MRKYAAILFCLLLGCATMSALANKDAEVFQPVREILGRLRLTPEDFQSLADRQVIVRPLSSRSTKEMAALGIVLADAPPAGFLKAYKTLAIFQNNPCITEIGLFSSAPQTSDLDRLTIDPIDVYGLSRARRGDSDIKLSDAELGRIQKLAFSHTRLSLQARALIAEEYKRILLDRVVRYLASGDRGMGAYVDKPEPVDPNRAFQSLANEQAADSGFCPDIFDYLNHYPTRLPPSSESFLYWAKQKFHDLKSIVSLVHLLIHRDGQRIFIASKQIYSSHYNEAGLSVAELIPFDDYKGRSHTVVVYTLRLEPDMLGGPLGFMKKRMAMPKLQITLRDSLARIRDNLESAKQTAPP
jgi:hypothetical protein